MIDQVMKQIGLDKALNSLDFESSYMLDILKALVAITVKNNVLYNFALEWNKHSISSKLYPEARLNYPIILEFLESLGYDSSSRRFFPSYFQNVIHPIAGRGKTTSAILIDSFGLTKKDTYIFSETFNKTIDVKEDIRVIYVIDKNTKLPIYFNLSSTDTTDNASIISTIDALKSWNINVEMSTMDGSNYTDDGLKLLIDNKIDFVIRMPQTSDLFEKIMEQHAQSLENLENDLVHQYMAMFGKKVPVTIFGKKMFAYLIQNVVERYNDIVGAIFNHRDDDIILDDPIPEDVFKNAGMFLLLSSMDRSPAEILDLYDERKVVEKLSDISKADDESRSYRDYTDESLRGTIFISFIASIISSIIDSKLSDTTYKAESAAMILEYLRINMYKNIYILEEMQDSQKELFDALNLEIPLVYQNEKVFKSKPLISNLKSLNKTRGRPKGSKATISDESNQNANPPEGTHEKGHPVDSINKANKEGASDIGDNVEGKRPRGRPKGSKNKK
jgi:hypothetical protein